MADIQTPVALQECCKETLLRMNDKMELGKYLRGALATAPVAVHFWTHPLDSLASLFNPAPSVVSKIRWGEKEWSLFRVAVESTDVILRERLKTEAGLERVRHSGDLYRFWGRIYDSL